MEKLLWARGVMPRSEQNKLKSREKLMKLWTKLYKNKEEKKNRNRKFFCEPDSRSESLAQN